DLRCANQHFLGITSPIRTGPAERPRINDRYAPAGFAARIRHRRRSYTGPDDDQIEGLMHLSIESEFGPHHRVIRCTSRLSWLAVDIRSFDLFGQRRRSENVIDPPAPVVIKSVAEVIPVGVLHAIGM